jgi:hypothetical protein
MDGKVSISVLNSLDSIFDRNPNPCHIYINGNELLSFPTYGFDLYSIDETSVEKKYKFDYKRLKKSIMIKRSDNYHQIKNNQNLTIRNKNPEDKSLTFYRIQV